MAIILFLGFCAVPVSMLTHAIGAPDQSELDTTLSDTTSHNTQTVNLKGGGS